MRQSADFRFKLRAPKLLHLLETCTFIDRFSQVLPKNADLNENNMTHMIKPIMANKYFFKGFQG